MTDPSHTLSAIPGEGDPAEDRTTTPEPAPAAEIQVRTEPEPPPRTTDKAPPASEPPDTASSDVTSDSAAPAIAPAVAPDVAPEVIAPPLAALGFPEGEPQSLHPAHLRTQMIGHWITIAVMCVGAFTILTSLTLTGKLHGVRLAVIPSLVFAGIGAIALGGWRYQHLEHARTSFVISSAGCEIRRGVLWRRIITVPLSRIQHSDVTQGPLQRAYGLATLALYTAGTEHAKIDLHGLAFDTAMAIRQYLFERSDAHER